MPAEAAHVGNLRLPSDGKKREPSRGSSPRVAWRSETAGDRCDPRLTTMERFTPSFGYLPSHARAPAIPRRSVSATARQARRGRISVAADKARTHGETLYVGHVLPRRPFAEPTCEVTQGDARDAGARRYIHARYRSLALTAAERCRSVHLDCSRITKDRIAMRETCQADCAPAKRSTTPAQSRHGPSRASGYVGASRAG